MVPEDGFPVGMQDPHTNRVVGHYKWLPASTRQEDQTGLALCCHASFLPMDPFVSTVHYSLIKLWASYTSHNSIYEAKAVLEWSTMLVNGFCLSVQPLGLKERIHVPVLQSVPMGRVKEIKD